MNNQLNLKNKIEVGKTSCSQGLGCICCKGVRPLPHKKRDVQGMIVHLMVKLQSWSLGECEVPLDCYYTQEGPFWPGVVLPVTVLSMDQINLFKNYSNSGWLVFMVYQPL